MRKFAKLIIQTLSDKLDRFFTYEIPDELLTEVLVGSVVKIPFGKQNKSIFGFVFETLYEENLCNEELKYLKNIKFIRSVDKRFQLSNYSLELIKFIKKKYLSSYYEAINLFLPSKFLEGANLRLKEVIYLDESVVIKDKFKKLPYLEIIKFVYENNFKYDKNELCREQKFSRSSVSTLLKHGIFKVDSKEKDLINSQNYYYEKKQLNYEQERVYNSVINGFGNKFLLFGITGSGKTEIYLWIFEEIVKNGGDCLILVPEISLTPQMIERVKGAFNNNVAIYHSKLTDNERYTEWQKVNSGKVKVAIGTRSSLFLPFKNLSCIIIDEEHEGSYKSDSDPKYITRDVAIEYGKIKNDLKVILGSATPSIESYKKAVDGEYELLKLENRANLSLIPKSYIVNMKDELKNGNKSIFSKKMYEMIKDRISKNEQIILFLNKRGYSSFVSCRSCGYVYKCKKCDITLTYHGVNSHLICHYCGYAEIMKELCVSCGSKYVKHFGIGTEKVEFITKKLFQDARVLRMDFDTTRKKNSYSEIYDKIKNQHVDIIIGTQMIAKGFDFKNVTLVGILAADITMNMPDYKAYERTFQLLNQVSGRAGRGSKSGEVLIQTYDPDSYVMKCVEKNDYSSFFNQEILIRKTLNYPPFTDMLNILLQSKELEFYDKFIVHIYDILLVKFGKIYQLLGPSFCMISKINEFYRWQIIVKGNYDYEIYNYIKKLVYEHLKNCKLKHKVSFDVNPYSII